MIPSCISTLDRPASRQSEFPDLPSDVVFLSGIVDGRTIMDWRDITDEKEKYAAYLCSREWSEKREAVRKRSRDKCERCRVLSMDACHHVTYKRKYNETLEDLQGICNSCHEFTHGKNTFDPKKYKGWLKYLEYCKSNSRTPISEDFLLSWGYTKEDCAASKMELAKLMVIVSLHEKADELTRRSFAINHPGSSDGECLLWLEAEEIRRVAHRYGNEMLFEFNEWARLSFPDAPIDVCEGECLYEHTLQLFGMK